MNKNDLINQYFNKAIEEMEMAETHSDKCKCCIAIAEFIAKHVENIDDNKLQISNSNQVQTAPINNSAAKSNTANQNIIQMTADGQAKFEYKTGNKTFIFPVDAEGIPYIPDRFNNDSTVIAAFNTMKMKSAEYKKLVENSIKKNAENILNENQGAPAQQQVQQQAPAQQQSVQQQAPAQQQPIQQPVQNNNEQQQQSTDEYSEQDVNNFIGYLQQVYSYNTNPQVLNEYVQMFTEGNYNSLEQIQANKEILKNFAIFMNESLANARNYLEEYKKNTENGQKSLDVIVANAFGNQQCTEENSINDSNIIEFAEYLKNVVAWNIFSDYVGNGSNNLDSINKIIKTVLGDQNANINSVNLNNVRPIVEYMQNLKNQA